MQKRNDFYYLDDERVYPSVTAILDVIAKPALVAWAARMGVRAALVDPTITEEDASYAIYQVQSDASVRGRIVHHFAERYGTNDPMMVEELGKDLEGYAEAWKAFYEAWRPKILYKELLVYSDKHEYAGTLDMIAEINGKKYILDIKTGKYIYETYPLQVEAYRVAVEEMGVCKIDKTAIVLLREDDSYIFNEVEGDIDVFLAAKKLWIWQNKDKYLTRKQKITKIKGGKDGKE